MPIIDLRKSMMTLSLTAFHVVSFVKKFGVGDRGRTCMSRICNPLPNHSVHTHILLWHPPAVIIEYQDMTLSYPSHTPSTRFPKQGPFSHCQRPLGLKTTTRSCHATSHPVGHSIRRHPERSFINTVWISKTALI